MKLLQILGIAGFFLSTLGIAESARSAPGATSTATFNGSVAPSCTTTTNFPSTVYTSSGFSPLGLSGGLTTISANASATFNCNSNSVGISANLTTLITPHFTNATNLNLRSGTTGIGNDHLITITIPMRPPKPPVTLINNQPVNTTGSIILTTTSAATDTLGNVPVNIISTFKSTSGAEELAAGSYKAIITITVTAQ